MSRIRMSADLQQRIIDSLVSLQPAPRPAHGIAIPFDRIVIARPCSGDLDVSLHLGQMEVGSWPSVYIRERDTLTVTGIRGYYDLDMEFKQ